METWKKGIWATAGIALFILALGTMATWYVATGNTVAPVSFQNPFIIAWAIVGSVGLYMVAAALGDWPLPGRKKAKRELAAQRKLEALKTERRLRDKS